MYHKEISEKQSSAWLGAALAAPLVQSASACSWPVALSVGGVCLLTSWAVTKYIVEPDRWIRVLQCLWACVIMSELLHWSTYCWPTHPSYRAAPLTLLLLATWATGDGGEKAARLGCVLLGPLALLLGAVLLSGIPDVEMKNLKPSWQMPDAYLIMILLLPILHGMGERNRNGRRLAEVMLFTLAVSLVTAGVLSPDISSNVQSPIYELSRSLSLLGIAERFESLIAAAMTMGYFSALTYLLSVQESLRKGKKTLWGSAVISGLLFFMNLRADSRLLAIGSILIWVILPVICHWKNNLKKHQKKLDK